MRVSACDEFATLNTPSIARLGSHTCHAEAGSLVKIVGHPSRPDDAGPRRTVVVRIVAGKCAGYEMTVEESALDDLRSRP